MNDIYKQKRWVVWQLEEVNGRQTKVPYSIRGKRASSTDASTWATYEEVKKASEFFGNGIGVIFTPSETLLGIDIDHVLENKKLVGDNVDSIKALIKSANTYTEISPSGTGLHLYLSLTDRLPLLANRHSPFEAYTSGRFFTFTETSFGPKKPIRTASPEEAIALLSLIGYPWGKLETETPSTETGLLTGPRFEDDELIERMFASKNGPAIKALFDGDLSEHKDDASRADAALLNHLAFWSGKDQAQMERVWLVSTLGAREKTRKRKDYRDRSIAGAIANCKEVYKGPQDHTNGIDFLTTIGSKGEKVVIQNTENIARVLREHEEFKGTLRQDSFANMYERKENGVWRQFEDVDAIDIQTRISTIFPFFRKVGKDMVYDAIIKIFKESRYDSAIEYVTSLTWDGEARLDHWLSKVYGTADDAYHAAVASNWFKGLVKRIIEPGCKFDYVLVLEGDQGVKKSTSLHVLGQLPNGRNGHVETTMSTDNKDFFMQFAGKFIVEFSEGETLNRTEVKKMKAIITTQSDKYRPPYERVSQDFPRRCVFAMTTNQDEYLKDETGNRRWLPVKVLKDKADIEWLEANKDQLYAEAHHRLVVAKETVYEFPEEETKAQQSQRQVADPNTDRIVDWYYHDQFLTDQAKENGITVEMVWKGCLNGFGPLKKFDEMAISNVLKNVLKLEKRRKMVDGYQGIRWFMPESPIQQTDLELPLEVEFRASDHGFEEEDMPFGDE